MRNYDFTYLIDKILDAEFEQDPFVHIYLEDFFSAEHFEEIINSDEIIAPDALNDRQLIRGLQERGFKPINFPGCITDIDAYIRQHESGEKAAHHSACEGFGMSLRLYEFSSPILEEINVFLASDEFNAAIAKKFNLDIDACITDGGIQKYLDGYEISPHPDIRRKAATFMVNINPNDKSEEMDHHTHYLKFDAAHEYVEAFWRGNPSVDRAWVPWDWSITVKQQRKNNSIVLFSPSDDTLHGVKTNYDHLVTQRTQLYGNLWYKESLAKSKIEWEDLDLLDEARERRKSASSPKVKGLRKVASSVMPLAMKSALSRLTGHDTSSVGQRKI